MPTLLVDFQLPSTMEVINLDPSIYFYFPNFKTSSFLEDRVKKPFKTSLKEAFEELNVPYITPDKRFTSLTRWEASWLTWLSYSELSKIIPEDTQYAEYLYYDEHYPDIVREILENLRPKLRVRGRRIIIGGDHCISWASFKESNSDMLLVIDKHSDIQSTPFLRNYTWLRILMEESNIEKIIHLGSYKSNKWPEEIQAFSYEKINSNPSSVINEVKKYTKDSYIHVSLDIDAIKGAPSYYSSGYLSRRFVKKLLEHLESKVSNIDITEYQPALDYKGNFKNYILSLIKLLDR
jgi:arginase family enzyme